MTPSRKALAVSALLLFAAIVFAVIVFAVTVLVQYSRNTLANNGRWVNTKLLMQMPLTGATHFMYTRNALHRNRLNLQEWHGLNEVNLNEVFAFGRITARFRLGSGGYLNVLFNRDGSGGEGLRLSRNGRIPSMLFLSDRSGRFTETHPLEDGPAQPVSDGWHELDLGIRRGRLYATLDGLKVVEAAVEGKPFQFVGLRGSMRPAAVDSLRIWDAEGREVVDETFSNTRGASAVLLGFAVAFLATGTPLVWLAMRRCDARGRRRALTGVLAVEANLLAVILIVCGFDYFIWSGRYVFCEMFPREGEGKPSMECRVESLRTRLFGVESLPETRRDLLRSMSVNPLVASSLTAWDGIEMIPWGSLQLFSGRAASPLVVGEEGFRPPQRKKDDVFRIVWLGTSQTVGVGAETVEGTFVAVAHRLLSHRRREGELLESYNLSIPGGNAELLLERFRRMEGSIRPDLVVINLSNNDDRHTLGPGLRRLLRIGERVGAETVFLLEANCAEEPVPELLLKHGIVRDIAGESTRPVWNLHGWLAGEKLLDSGHLWWDGVHLTSWGHEVTGRWLAGKIASRFPEVFP